MTARCRGCASGTSSTTAAASACPPERAQARGELQLGAVPVRLVQPAGQRLLVERRWPPARRPAVSLAPASSKTRRASPGCVVESCCAGGHARRGIRRSARARRSRPRARAHRARATTLRRMVRASSTVPPWSRIQATTSERSAWHMSADARRRRGRASAQRLERRRARWRRPRRRATPALASPSRMGSSVLGGATAKVVLALWAARRARRRGPRSRPARRIARRCGRRRSRGARRTAPPGAASPRATSSSASSPASLCAMSMMTVALAPRRAAASRCSSGPSCARGRARRCAAPR